MTMKEAAQKTLDVQNACNLSGVAHSFSEIMTFLTNEMIENGHGGDWKNGHPIAKLWIDKMASLAGIQNTTWEFYTAYTEVSRLAEEEA